MAEQIELKVRIPAEVLTRLKQAATERDIAVEDLVSDVLSGYADEPSKAEILDGIERGLREALRGDGQDAFQALDEIDAELRHSTSC